jgi:hypothetical protein
MSTLTPFYVGSGLELCPKPTKAEIVVRFVNEFPKKTSRLEWSSNTIN